MFLALGQAAWVFQVLAKAAPVPSTTPLLVRKSSAWMLLKFPQRPGEESHVEALCRLRDGVGARTPGCHLLPQVSPRSSGASRTNTCMVGTSWMASCTPRLVCAMMKKVEGLKRVTLAADTAQGFHWEVPGRTHRQPQGGSGPVPSPVDTGSCV